MIKLLFLAKEKKKWMIETIKSHQDLKFKLYLWKIFIETVSEIDTKLGFMEYRNLVYTFQEDVIPVMFDDLMPYFHAVRSNIEVNVLSGEMGKTNVSEGFSNPNEKIQLFSPEEQPFSKLVFDILYNVICYTYNITYSEYDM